MQDISDCLSPQAQNVAEARLAAKRAARAEAREIRMKELERQQKEVEERSDKDFGEKDSLAEVEEKYKRSMVTNAQLDNEKTSLQYQVDTLREVLLELEEELAESRRQYEDKHKECERQRHDQNVLRFQLAEMKEALEQRESLLAKHGIALDSVGTPNGDASLEPHVNADGRPDPPIRATSMGPSEKAVEKKEMSVVSESSPSKPEQDNQEVLLTVASETPLNAELGDKAKEENIQEIASNSNEDVDSHKTARSSNDDVHAGGCRDLEHQGEGVPPDSESTSNENEKSVNECAPPNLNTEVLEQNISEVHREATPDQRVSSPVESEVFQDALDNIVLSPCATSPPSNQLEACVGDFGNDTSKQDFIKEEERYEVQSTSVERERDINADPLLGSECIDNTAITTDTSDLHTNTTDGQESSINDSIQFKLEERAADEMSATPVEHESVCEEVVKPEEQTVPAESGLQCKKDASEVRDSNANYAFSEKEFVSNVSNETALHTNIHDVVEEKNTDITPEQSSKDIQLAKEEHQLDSENNNFSEAPEPCIARSTQSTVESEPQRDSDIFEDSISHLDQHEDIADAGSLKANQESLENDKNTVFQNAAEALDIGEHVTLSDKSEKTCEDPKSSDVPDEGKADTISDNPVCIESENMNEKINTVLKDVSSTELLDEKKLEETSDLLNQNENVTDVTETPKESVSSETFSEGASTPEGEESDDNDDNEDDVAVRSEKYTGESLPLGSSVDQTSADDIRMEDSADKASRRGKGKNKEDCVVS